MEREYVNPEGGFERCTLAWIGIATGANGMPPDRPWPASPTDVPVLDRFPGLIHYAPHSADLSDSLLGALQMRLKRQARPAQAAAGIFVWRAMEAGRGGGTAVTNRETRTRPARSPDCRA